MKTPKTQYILPIVLFLLIFVSFAVFSIFRIIYNFGSSQYRTITEITTQLFTERVESYIISNSMRARRFLEDPEHSDRIRSIFQNYQQNNTVIRRDVLNKVQMVTLPPESIRRENPFNHEIHLVAPDGVILASTNTMILGVRLIHYFNAPGNRDRLTQFLNSDNPTYSNLTIFENVDDLWFNLYIIHRLNYETDGRKDINGFMVYALTNLHIEQTYFTTGGAGELSLLAFDEKGYISFAYPSDYIPDLNAANENQERLKLTKDLSSIVSISNPYRDESGRKVIGARFWLGHLGIGLIVEQSADSILTPWYLMASLILLVMAISFLIFIIIAMLINLARIRAYDRNPLTRLPGNRSIMKKLKEAADSDLDTMIIYCDLDNFKAYNDLYGFSAGDEIIVYSAEMLKEHFRSSKNLFLGHIGGDDFVIIGPKELLQRDANTFGRDFDEGIKAFYSPTDREKGYIESQTRQGDFQRYPFIAMSMGGILLRNYPNAHPVRIAEICAEVKKFAKTVDGSKLILDSRKVPEKQEKRTR